MSQPSVTSPNAGEKNQMMTGQPRWVPNAKAPITFKLILQQLQGEVASTHINKTYKVWHSLLTCIEREGEPRLIRVRVFVSAMLEIGVEIVSEEDLLLGCSSMVLPRSLIPRSLSSSLQKQSSSFNNKLPYLTFSFTLPTLNKKFILFAQ